MNFSKIIYFMLMLFINLCYPYNFRDILNKVDLEHFIPCTVNYYLKCIFTRDKKDNQYTINLKGTDGTKEEIILKVFNDRFHKIYFKIIEQHTFDRITKQYADSYLYNIDNDIYPYKYIPGFYSDERKIKFPIIRIFLEYQTDRTNYLDIIIEINDIFKDYYMMNTFDDIYTILPVYTIESEARLNLKNRKEVEAALNGHIIESVSLDEVKDIFSKISKLKYFICTDEFCYYKNFKIYSKIKELGFKKPLYVVIRCPHDNKCLKYEDLFFNYHAILVYKDSLSGKFYVIDNNDETQQIHELFEFWGKIDKKSEAVLNIYSII